MKKVVPIIKQAVRSRKEDFGGLLFTNRTPILSLNEDSFLIWEAIDGKRSIAQICECLIATQKDKEIDMDVLIDFFKVCEDLDLVLLQMEPDKRSKSANMYDEG